MEARDVIEEREQPRVRVDRPRCPYCHDDLAPEQAKQGCESCLAWHHRECWTEHGGCSACGATASGAGGPWISPRERDVRRSLAEAFRSAVQPGLERASPVRRAARRQVESLHPLRRTCDAEGCGRLAPPLRGDLRTDGLRYCAAHAAAENRAMAKVAHVMAALLIAAAVACIVAVDDPRGGLVYVISALSVVGVVFLIAGADLRIKAHRWTDEDRLKRRIDAFEAKRGDVEP